MARKVLFLKKDEPYFTVRAKNPFAVKAMRAYAEVLRGLDELIRAAWADALADRFEAWQLVHPPTIEPATKALPSVDPCASIGHEQKGTE